MNETHHPSPLVLTIGHEELVIRKRYETFSIANDFLIAIWFVIGSVLFFSESTTVAGTWLFLIGSVELMIRPLIRLTRHVHLRRIRISDKPTENALDF
ncbi:MAG: YrhK family protein [Sciscionella sp.]